MKRLKHLTLLAFFLIAAMRGFGQKVKLEEGDLSPLRSEKTIAFAFTYDSMMIGSGKDAGHHPPHPPGPGHSKKEMTEAEYVAKHTEDYNKKSPGKGDD